MASAGSEFATAGTSMGAGMRKALIPALIAAAIPAAGALGGVAASAAQSLLLIPAAAGAAGRLLEHLLWLPRGFGDAPGAGAGQCSWASDMN